MSANAVNSCTFAGRLSKDPDIKQYNGPTGPFSKARFSVAVDRNLTSEQRNAAKTDNSIKTCDFVDFEATGPVVDKLIGPYLKKGKAVLIHCHYNTFEYNDQQTGQKKYAHNFIVDEIAFAPQDAKALSEGGNAGNNYQQNNSYQQNNGGYQQNNGGYQQNNNQQNNQPRNNNLNGFAMFDDNDQPF